MHCCKSCVVNLSPQAHYNIVRDESEAYLKKVSTQQEWAESDPALQLLLLPKRNLPPMTSYQDDPAYLDPSHCRLCLQPVPKDTLQSHLLSVHQISSIQEYRHEVFARTLAEWPQQITPQILRSRLAAFTLEMSDQNFRELPCASCARQKRICKLREVQLPPASAVDPPAWLPWDAAAWEVHRQTWCDAINEMFSIDRYLQRFFLSDERLAEAREEISRVTDPVLVEPGDPTPQRFVSVEAAQAWHRRVSVYIENVQRDLQLDSVPAPGREGCRWLLYASKTLSYNDDGAITCHLCRRCYEALSHTSGKDKRPAPRMPAEARANGLWRGPDPPQLAALSYSEAKVINLARVYVSVKRVFLDRSSYAPTTAGEAPLYHQKNVVAYPQNPDAAIRAVGMSPISLAKTIIVQFVGENREALRHEKDLRVSVVKLRDAFLWLSVNSWPFMEATKYHDSWESGALDPGLEALLKEYRQSVGSDTGGVPAELLQAAARIAPEHASVIVAGPAQCVPQENEAEDTCEDSVTGLPDDAGANSGGVLDGGVDDIAPLQLWDTIMKKYKVAQMCTQELQRLKRTGDESDQTVLLRERAVAVSTAVEALSKIHHDAVHKKLEDLAAQERSEETIQTTVQANTFLNNRDPLFWYSCFVRLFPRGDCAEKCSERLTNLPPWRWAKCLLTRADADHWRTDVEFIASLYNIFLRRDQVNAVELYYKHQFQEDSFYALSKGNLEDISKLTADGLVAHALSSGDVNSVKELLREKKLEKPIEKTFQQMQVIQRRVRGSEAEKDNLIPKFIAMRIHSGCSSLFFTLNPHDIRSPLTLSLLHGEGKIQKEFSLDFSDVEAEQYVTDLLGAHPRKLHYLVAQNPIVGTKCFHWTVKLVIRLLFNCAATPGENADNIAANELPGVFGYVRAYFGVVEPQKRKTLHTHMLVQLLGFAHPQDLLRDDVLPDIFRRVWWFVASICFRSTEAFAHFLHHPAAMAALREAPLLPLTTKQRGMIGESRVHESVKAQLLGRGLTALPDVTDRGKKMSFFPSSMHANASIDAGTWASRFVGEVAVATRKSGNHVCRPDVCHKGRIGRRGFCRMYFWHWARCVSAKNEPVARMTHGHELCERWNGTGEPPVRCSPPFVGAPALEVTHPFHFKMTPSMLLGPTCNHDLNCFLRLPKVSSDVGSCDEVVNAMLDAMGDHEYYSASYASKTEPQMEGLLHTLIDGMRRKEVEIRELREAGRDFTPHDIARSILHRLIACTNRRMHKGFPEMLTYLLQKPMEYTSHKFYPVPIQPLIRKVFACVNPNNANADPVLFEPGHTSSRMVINIRPALYISDYRFRSHRLDLMPLYFFFSSCEPSDTLSSSSLDWEELETVAGTERQRSYDHQPLRSAHVHELPLLHAVNKPIHKYGFYHRLRTHEAWRVPVLFGKLPRAPHADAPVYERGFYGAFLMMLFRPYRSFEDTVRIAMQNHHDTLSPDDKWLMMESEYLRWREVDVCAKAAKYRSERPKISDFFSEGWWACLIEEKLRNYETAMRRHTSDSLHVPACLHQLPAYEEKSYGRDDSEDEKEPHSDAQSEPPNPDGAGLASRLDDPAAKPNKKPKSATSDPLATHCGVLPLGSQIEDFHNPPLIMNVRSGENLYWQNFARQHKHCFGELPSDENVRASNPTFEIAADDALTAVTKQIAFFKSIDSMRAEIDDKDFGKKDSDDFGKALKKSISKLHNEYLPSETIVMENAFFLISEGLVNIPDVGTINVKQARAFLWNAAWLQEHMNKKWRDEGVLPRHVDSETKSAFDDFCLAIMGPGGTGKTAVLRMVEALTVFFAGVDSVRKLAPSNAAARLLGGDTLHALCKLPFGNTNLRMKQGRLAKPALRNHQKQWAGAIQAFVDEISMVSADQLLQCDVRLRQAKLQPNVRFGNLAMNLCGDFLQLPPVDTHGTRKSLALPVDAVGNVEVEEEACAAQKDATEIAQQTKRKEQAALEGRQGFELWRSITTVVNLYVNVRAPGVLGRLQAEMRSGKISDQMWELYTSRIMVQDDARLRDTSSPFTQHPVTFIVHRHKIRAMRSLETAREETKRLQTPLYLLQARDEAVRIEDEPKLTATLRADLLRRVNPEHTKSLPSFLPLYVGMRLLLSSKDCVRIGIMKGCPCVVESIVLAPDEIVPFRLVAGAPHPLVYMPVSLLLRAEKADWILPRGDLPASLPKHVDRRGLFQIRPTYDYLSVQCGMEYIRVRRTTFKVLPADTITVYTAQGGTFDAVVADMQRPPNLPTSNHWLACYVMISRAKDINGFLVLRPATRKELESRPPQYLLDELQRLHRIPGGVTMFIPNF